MEMRRKMQLLSVADTEAVIARGTSGVLSILGDDDYPYGVPLSYAYADRTFYFHSSNTGHKISAISHHPKASFTIIDCDHVVPEEYTTYYRSVIAFGTVEMLMDEKQKRAAIELLAERYTPEDAAGRLAEIERLFPAFSMIALKVERMTGKEAVALVRARNG